MNCADRMILVVKKYLKAVAEDVVLQVIAAGRRRYGLFIK